MSLLIVEQNELVARVSLDRPEARNALTIDLCEELIDALRQIDDGREVRCVVLKGEGKVFCSGADMSALNGRGGPDFVAAFEAMLDFVARFRLPTVAMIHGAALGGGLQLATACDFRITERDARIGIPAARIGVVVNYENVERLVHLAGAAVAKEVLMTGRTFSGDEALRAGLVTRSVPGDHLEDDVNDLVTELTALSPLSVQGAKKAIQVTLDAMSQMREEPGPAQDIAALVAEAYASEDLVEGLAALRDKRLPSFKHR